MAAKRSFRRPFNVTFAAFAAAAVLVAQVGADGTLVPAAAAVRVQAKPKAQNTKAVHGVHAVPARRVARNDAASRRFEATHTRFPKAATAQVAVPARGAAVAAAGTPVKLAESATSSLTASGGAVTVRQLASSVASGLGINGSVFSLASATGRARTMRLTYDYSSFAQASGGNYGLRLGLVQLPACALTAPQAAACRGQTAVRATNDANRQVVSASVSVPASGSVVLAVTPSPVTTSRAAAPSSRFKPAVFTTSNSVKTVLAADTTASGSTAGDGGGPAGSYAATSLSPTGSWAQGGSTGSFTYSYPLTMPSAADGLAPTVALGYDSGGVDGKTSATSAQSSWIGDGWDTPENFIEQSYESCKDVDSSLSSVDQCYAGPVLTLSLNGVSTSLVCNASYSSCTPQQDDGAAVAYKTDGTNGTWDGDYWVITERDGTKYYFGLNQLPGYSSASSPTATNSVQTVPVYSADSSGPCYHKTAATFAGSVCTMAYRWNLDYTVDLHGAAMAYYYGQSVNYYGQNLGATRAKYVRDAYLARIDYGFTAGNAFGKVGDRVVFDTDVRCVASSCGTLSSSTAANYPDVPYDLVCTSSGTCTNYSPSFFSTVRLTSITTQQYSTAAAAFVPVDKYTLTQTIPSAKSGDSSAPTLWLSSIQRTASSTDSSGTTTSASMPSVDFTATQLQNRVDTTTVALPPMYRNRVGSITTETGSVITVLYDLVSGCASPVTVTASSNTSSCFPVTWTPEGYSAPVPDWFNKYVVVAVNQTDTTGGAQALNTGYTYKGGAAWHYDDNEVVKKKYRSYGQFRGYAEVQTRTGDGNTDAQTLTDTTYYRGMGSSVTDSLGGDHTDHDELRGKVLETRVYQGSGGGLDHTAISSYWRSAATATRTRTGLSDLTARIVGAAETLNRQWIAPWGSGDYRTTETDTAYDTDTGSDTYGLPLYAYSHAVPVAAAYDRCTSTAYAKVNSTLNLVGLVSQTETDSVACSGFSEGSTVSVPGSTLNAMGAPSSVSRPAQVVSATRTFYDVTSFATTFPQAVTPSLGDVTMTETANDASSNTLTWQVTAKNVNDSYGRVTSTTDGLGRVSSTGYTDNAYGLTTAMKATNNLTQSTSTTLNPERGTALTVTDPNGIVTTSQYDTFGRITALWLASRSTSDPANYTYSYTIAKTGVSGSTTNKLNTLGGYVTTTDLYDSLLRPRQFQTATPRGGRMVTDTIYDSRGFVEQRNNGWWDSATTPTTTIVTATDLSAQVPNSDEYTYDGLGRPVIHVSYDNVVEVSREYAVYSGDRTTVIPPTGGIIQSTVTDVLGRTVEQDQYTSTPAVTAPSNTTTGHWTITGGTTTGTTYGYDGHGNQTTITDSLSHTWSSTYDLMGRVTAKSDPDAGNSSMSYDADGDLLQTTDSRLKTVSYTYDGLGRKTAAYDAATDSQVAYGSTGANQTASWVYDSSSITNAIGHVTTATSYAGGAAYVTQAKGFTAFGASLGQTVTIPSTENSSLAGTYTFTHTYDSYVGLPYKDGYPSAGGLPAETVVHSYTGYMDAPTGLTGTIGLKGYGYTSDVSYDAYGRVLQATLGASSTVGMAYVTNTWNQHTGQLKDQTISRSLTSPSTVDEHAYSYDLAGNPTRDVETRLGDTSTTETQCYAYDSVDRLTAAWTATDACATTPTDSAHTTVGDPLSAAAAYWTTWTYNTIGQRVSQVQHATTSSGTSTTTTSTYTAGSTKLSGTATTGASTATTSYGYDTAGNMNSRATTTATQALTWNNAGQLAAVTTTDTAGTSTSSSYVYDTDGNLLTQHDGAATILYLPGEQLSVNAAGTVSSVRYYPLPGGGTAYRTGTGTNYGFKIGDLHGTSSLTLDYTGQTPTWRQFTPFGEARGTTPTSWVDNRTFLDKTTDTVTGLTNVGARYYDPSTGSFISLDPVLDAGNPQSLNGYSYAGNNPVTNSDPTGLDYQFQHPDDRPTTGSTPTTTTTGTGDAGSTNSGSNGGTGASTGTTNTGGGTSTRTTEQHHGWCHWPSWHTIAKVAVGVVVTVAVTAAVAGVCATGVGCVILAATVAGAASGAASYGTGVALGDDEFSAKGLATATVTGAAVGAVTGGLGAGASAVKTAVTEGAEGAAESAGASAVTDTATAAEEGAETGATKTAAQEGPRGKGTPGPDDPASVTEGGRSTGGQAVAGHGWHARSNGTTTVPPGTYLHFYVEHGERLADSVGLQVERGARNIMPVETFGPGSRIPNYTIAPPRGLNVMSGSTTVTQPRLLSEMFEDGTISGVSHMAVCREVIPW